MTDMRTLYSYNADTRRAQVYSRLTGAVILDVEDVDIRVGSLLYRLADEMYQDGVEAGRAEVFAKIGGMIDRMKR